VDAALSGVLVVDKPAGPTSHDIVDRVRRALGVRRVGHTGTLDPFATGVLLVCVGKATRLVRFLAEGDKVYRATVRLGFATTTDDLTGGPLTPARPVSANEGALAAACHTLTGVIDQLPPVFSAKRVGGRRLYELAREGVAVAPSPSRVTVHELRVLEFTEDRLEIEVRCSPGTYVRALARDLGEALGCGGHLLALRRTRSSGFGLDAAASGDDLDAHARDRLLPLRACLTDVPAIAVGAVGLQALAHGRDLTMAMIVGGLAEPPAPLVRVLGEDGDLLALAVPRGFGFRAPGLQVEPTFHPDVVLVGSERAQPDRA
jgi:tRNA pseudouridine55 synthase